jgi:hypothetical protein
MRLFGILKSPVDLKCRLNTLARNQECGDCKKDVAAAKLCDLEQCQECGHNDGGRHEEKDTGGNTALEFAKQQGKHSEKRRIHEEATIDDESDGAL